MTAGASAPQSTRAETAVCSTPDCGYPVSDVEFWADQARTRVPKYWLDHFVDDGNPASPAGLCTDCGGEWFSDLDTYRDANRCNGGCSPYDNCPCILMLPEGEY